MFSCELCEISKNTFLKNNSGGCFSKHNVTMQTTAEFASNSTANIKLSEHLSFFLVTSNKFFTKSKCSRKKIMWWSSCPESSRKTNLLQLFCNVVGYKTRMSIVLGYMQPSPRMFLLACNLLISRKIF